LRRGAKRVYAATRGAPLTTPRKSSAAKQVQELDVLINNAGVAIYDDLHAASL